MNFLTQQKIQEIEQNYQTPVYVYSENKLIEAADNFLSFPSAFWHKVRYAMKANPNINILKIFKNKGIKIDFSLVSGRAKSGMSNEEWENLCSQASEMGLDHIPCQELAFKLIEHIEHCHELLGKYDGWPGNRGGAG